MITSKDLTAPCKNCKDRKILPVNCLKWGVGAINIDGCRVKTEENISIHNAPKGTFAGGEYDRGSDTESYRENTKGRYPANVITDGSDEVASGMPDTKGGDRHNTCVRKSEKISYGFETNTRNEFDDEGSAMRYFYSAKASKKDRDEGLDSFEAHFVTDGCERSNFETAHKFGASSSSSRRNIHPTVKPVELMQYLVRLVTKAGGDSYGLLYGKW